MGKVHFHRSYTPASAESRGDFSMHRRVRHRREPGNQDDAVVGPSEDPNVRRSSEVAHREYRGHRTIPTQRWCNRGTK